METLWNQDLHEICPLEIRNYKKTPKCLENPLSEFSPRLQEDYHHHEKTSNFMHISLEN